MSGSDNNVLVTCESRAHSTNVRVLRAQGRRPGFLSPGFQLANRPVTQSPSRFVTPGFGGGPPPARLPATVLSYAGFKIIYLWSYVEAHHDFVRAEYRKPPNRGPAQMCVSGCEGPVRPVSGGKREPVTVRPGMERENRRLIFLPCRTELALAFKLTVTVTARRQPDWPSPQWVAGPGDTAQSLRFRLTGMTLTRRPGCASAKEGAVTARASPQVVIFFFILKLISLSGF